METFGLVIDPVNNKTLLKRAFFLFDKIVTVGDAQNHSFLPPDELDVHWLHSEGLLIFLEGVLLPNSDSYFDNAEDRKSYETIMPLLKGTKFQNLLIRQIKASGSSHPNEVTFTRMVTPLLRQQYKLNIFPVLGNRISFDSNAITKDDVYELVIRNLPIPSDATPWEALQDFRSDPDSVGKLLGLKNWINEIAHGNLSTNEAEEKLEYLIHEYRSYMNLHKMKHDIGKIETLFTTTAELLENVIKLNFSNIVETSIKLKRRKLALLAAEKVAPGREIAYIVKAQENF